MLILIVVLFVVLFSMLKASRMDSLSFFTLLVFYLYWFVQLILSQFQIHNVYMPSIQSTIYLMIGVVSFSFGYYAVKIKPTVIHNYKINIVDKLKDSINTLVENKWFQLLLVVTAIYIVSLDVYFFDAIAAGAFIRTEGISMAEYYGPTFAKLNTYLFCWYIPLMRPIFCYCFLYRRKWYLPFMALLLLGFEILSGGRIGLIRTFIPVFLIIGLFRVNKGYKFKLKQIVSFIIIVVGIYYGVIALTAFRAGTTDFSSAIDEGQELTNDALVTYFVGPAVAFDQVIHSNIIDATGGFKFGLNVLWPLLFPLLFVLYIAGATNYINGPAGAVSDFLQFNYLSVGAGTRWNALYTWNVDFFCDAGIIGIIVFNFLFGYLMRFCFKWMYNKGTVYNLIIVSIVYVMVLQAPIKLYGMFNLLPILIYILLYCHSVEAKRLYRNK